MKDRDVPIALAFCGEFGSKIVKHVPGIRGIPRPLIICHEAGEEPLYPDATERYVFDRPPAVERKAGGNIYQQQGANVPEDFIPYHDRMRKHFEPDVWKKHLETSKPPEWQRTYIDAVAPFKLPPQYFVPEHTGTYDLDFDVLLFARRQEYCHARNWMFWSEFQQALAAEGIRCLVAGQPDSTAQLDCPAVWDLISHPSQILDCTIWAIKKAKMRIGTSTGTSLLSVFCGENVIVITAESGHNCQGSKLTFPAGYFYKADSQRMGYRVISHWMEWERVIEEFLWMYRDLDKFNADCRDWIKKIDIELARPDPDLIWRNLK